MPNFADAYFNLGNLVGDMGRLEEEEIFITKAIELDPNYARHTLLYLVQNIQPKTKNPRKIFEDNFLENKNNEDKMNIFFARSNILHNQKNFIDSAKYLNQANNLKLEIKPSECNTIIDKSRFLFIQSPLLDLQIDEANNIHESIFIVGMPRSGSTLLESILTMNKKVYDLGETTIFKEALEEIKKNNRKESLLEIYCQKMPKDKKQLKITTDKNLYNYQYSGIIAGKLPNAKIIIVSKS